MKSSLLYISLLLLSSGLRAQVNVNELGQIPQELKENSGHIFHNGKLISHNDSGNLPVLYALDTVTMEITKRVTVSNAINIDWEDISQDDDFFYIADLGNYSGTRTDLVVYKILKMDFDNGETVTAETINFHYEDQEEFVDNGKSNWDAEALTVFEDQLWIFTKQWIDEGTVVYSIPKNPGNHTAKRVAAYTVDGLVTGATFNERSNDLVLIGYSNTLQPFVLRAKDIDANSIFTDNVERIPLDIGFGQAEAITSVTANRYLIGTEEFQRNTPSVHLDPTLYSVQFLEDNETNGEVPDMEEVPDKEEDPEIDPGEDRLILYGAYDSDIIHYDLESKRPVLGHAIFDTSGKMLQFRTAAEIEDNDLDVTVFKSGVYYFTLYLGDKKLSKAFVAY